MFEAGFVWDRPVLAQSLCFVKGKVRAADKRRGVEDFRSGGRHAHADRDSEMLPRSVCNALTDAVGKNRGGFCIGIRKQESYLLTSVAADKIGHAGGAKQEVGDTAEDFVAFAMAEIIVERFEVIDVEQQHGEHRAIAGRNVEFSLQPARRSRGD